MSCHAKKESWQTPTGSTVLEHCRNDDRAGIRGIHFGLLHIVIWIAELTIWSVFHKFFGFGTALCAYHVCG